MAKLLLLSHLLSLVDRNSIIHIYNRSIDIYKRVCDAIKDEELCGLSVKSIFISCMDLNSIGIEVHDSIRYSDQEIEEYSKYNTKFHEAQPITINHLVNDFNLGAREVIIRTNSSYLFAGSFKEFINYLECYKHRKIIGLKRLHVGESERNMMEIVVEEEVPRLQIGNILPYLYNHEQIDIMDWNQDWVYCGDANNINTEILDRLIDKIFISAQIPDRLIVLLKHK